MSGIPEPLIQLIFEHAEKQYPEECCGLILGKKLEPDDLSRVRICRNAQNEFHERFPEEFVRTAKTAYYIDPKELLEAQKETRESQEEIRVIFHSHVDSQANFSEEDRKMALTAGNPCYPGVKYLVVSVVDGRASDYNLFSWDFERKEFVS